MENGKLNGSSYFAYKLISILVCLIGLELPTNIIRNMAKPSVYQLVFAYAIWVVLPIAAFYFLWQIVKSKTYQLVYPFKWFYK